MSQQQEIEAQRDAALEKISQVNTQRNTGLISVLAVVVSLLLLSESQRVVCFEMFFFFASYL